MGWRLVALTALVTSLGGRLKKIITQHGWPGSNQFGGKAANAAFFIVLHSDLSYQKRYLPLARDAAAKGDMPPSSLAFLEDRVRQREGQKQIDGSQVAKNAADEWEPLPLDDEAKVDALRARAGLPADLRLPERIRRPGRWSREPEMGEDTRQNPQLRLNGPDWPWLT